MVRKESDILLGLKKRGFGMNKWNGFGGKVDPSETVLAGALRELEEEAYVKATDSVFKGFITFEFENDPTLLHVHIFKATNIEGEPKESEEMRPQWYSLAEIPFEKMWADDKIWFPYFLSDKYFHGYFLFRGHEEILNYTLEETTDETLRMKQKEVVGHQLD